MLEALGLQKSLSGVGFRLIIVSVAATIFLSFFDGLLYGPLNAIHTSTDPYTIKMFTVWVTDLRFFCENGTWAATLFFVGAKFLETRTTLTIGFDAIDASKMVFKGADDENVVWIGRRYSTRLEAESVAAALADRVSESAPIV